MADLILFGGVCISIIVLLRLLTPRSDIPGPWALPVLGNLLVMKKIIRGQHYKLYRELAKQYGEIYRLFIGRELIIRLNSYDAIHEAFAEKADIFGGRPDFLHNEGKGINCNSGEEFKTLKTFVWTKITSLDTLIADKQTHETKILRETEVLIDRLNRSLDQPVQINDWLLSASCNIITDIIFNARYQYEDEQLKELVKAEKICAGELPAVSLLGMIFPFLKPMVSIKKKTSDQMVLYTCVEKMVKECRNTFDEHKIRCLVDTFINAERTGELSGEAASEKNLVCTMFDILFAGIGGIGYLLSWCIVYMVRYPEIQEKCRNEIKKVVGNNRRVQLSDKSSLDYVYATILEIRRICNLVPITIPHVATENGTLKGYHVPKGAILIGDMLASYDVDLDNGNVFNPDRYLDSNGDVVRDHKSLIFGTGPRKCLGRILVDIEIFLLFSNIIQTFNFSKASPSDDLDFEGHLGIIMVNPDYKVKVMKNNS